MAKAFHFLTKFLNNISSEIDFFKAPINFKLNQQNKLSTSSGSILSLAIIIFISIIIFESDLFQKKHPKVLTSNLKTLKSEKINLISKIIAFGLQNDEGKAFLDYTVYSTNFKILVKNQANNYEVEERILKIHECEEKDFNKENKKLFDELSLKNNFCTNNSETLEIEGYWDEASLIYLMVELNICDNITMNGKCKSIEEIRKFMEIYNNFNIYIQNSYIDYNDFNEPIKSFIENQYVYIDLKYRKMMEILFKKASLSTDHGLIFENYLNLNEVIIDEKKSDFIMINNVETGTNLFRFELYASKNSLKIERTYERLSDLVAKLGGILKILMALGYIFTNVELKYRVLKIFLIALFKIPGRSNFLVKKKIKLKFYRQGQYRGETAIFYFRFF